MSGKKIREEINPLKSNKGQSHGGDWIWMMSLGWQGGQIIPSVGTNLTEDLGTRTQQCRSGKAGNPGRPSWAGERGTKVG
jgi:hypothetical protein